MKKAEAISILAASVRPREAKDRARYDEAVRMAIEALKCSETPKSSEQNAETAQADHIADTGRKVEQTAEIAQNVQNGDLIQRKTAILQLSHNKCGNEEWDIAVQHDIETITQLPTVQPDNQINLCDSCDYLYPDCPAKNDDVIFGNGIGNDNICACNKYKPSAQPEIIRCKDCKHWRFDHTCREHSLVSPMMANEFCSRAERREG